MTINEHEPKKTDDYLEAMRKLADEQNKPYHGGGSCPSCGYCHHCGRGGRQAHPFYPSSPPWTGGNTWGGGLTVGTGGLPGVTGPHFVTGMTVKYNGGPDVDPNASWTQE